MAKTKKENRNRQSDTKRKAADDNIPEDRRKRNRLAEQPAITPKEDEATSSQFEETSFKIRYAADIDDDSARSGGSRANENYQQQDRSIHGGDASQSVVFASDARSGHTTPLLRPTATSRRAITDGVDQEDVLVTILSQTSWDAKMTQATIKSLAGRAQQKAPPGNLFDVTYIDGLLARLDRSEVEIERRENIIAMLQGALYKLLGEWKSCIRRLGSRDCFLPSGSNVRERSQDVALLFHEAVPGSSKLLYVDVGRNDEDEGLANNRMHPPQTSPRSNNDDANSNGIESENDQDPAEHDWITTQEIIARRDSLPLLSTPRFAKTPHTTKSKDNLRIFGTRRPKTPFDVFARCVISAWALAPKLADEPVKIRAYARSKWINVVGRRTEQRAEWQKLYEVRQEPDIDVSALGHRLFLSQDLLQHVVPDERFQTVKTQMQTSSVRTRPRDAPDHPSSTASQQLPSLRSGDANDAIARRNTELGNHIVAQQDNLEFRQSHLQMPITFACSEAARYFPKLVQATSTSPSSQPCFVPTSTREYDSTGCLFVLNTPDVITGRIITAPDVRLACQQACFEGFRDVIRHNYNMFVAYFDTRAKAKRAGHVWALNFPVASTTSPPTNASTLIVRPSWYIPGAHNLFCCSIPKTSIKTHATIFQRIFEALDGPMVASFQLLKQTADEERVRYMLRRAASAPPIYIERFYIPLDHENGDGKIWGIFRPMNMDRKCDLCKAQCQAGPSSTCPYTTVMRKP